MLESTLKIIDLPKIVDKRGNLTFIQNGLKIPFLIKRVFWTYDVPSGEQRGGHAYKTQHEIIICLSGSFELVVKYSNNRFERILLNKPNIGIYLPPMTWRHLENFSTNSVSLHLSSSEFMEDDYIRDPNKFESNEKTNNTGM
jgi:hypothetical protein